MAEIRNYVTFTFVFIFFLTCFVIFINDFNSPSTYGDQNYVSRTDQINSTVDPYFVAYNNQSDQSALLQQGIQNSSLAPSIVSGQLMNLKLGFTSINNLWDTIELGKQITLLAQKTLGIPAPLVLIVNGLIVTLIVLLIIGAALRWLL